MDRMDRRKYQHTQAYFANAFLSISVPLTLLLRIREVPSSNLGPDIGYPDGSFSWFSSVPPCECSNSTLKLVHDHFLPNPSHSIIHLSPFNSTLYTSIPRTSLGY
jgi:hypothetical protein